jgi:S-adenosylmethionine:diacylglycerol 3-amino-3-carboxypropyl transferase
MYEDPAIELAAFRPGGRVCCIASAGCTAMALAPHHRVVAVDINPDQLAYAARRLAGAPAIRGTAERVMDVGRALAPAVGWSRARVARFLALDDPAAQVAYWHDHLATRRLRAILDALLSRPVLRAAYASTLLAGLPPHLGRTMRARLVRGFARHPNRTNPYARALLLGDLAADAPPPEARGVELVHADLAAYLEGVPAASFDAFTLSNILDGAAPAYAARLSAAVRRAAAPGAVVVRRSFGEPVDTAANRAADDRALLWGVVDVRAVADLRP